MEIELWQIGRPKPYERNPRKIGDKAVSKVAASIKEFGFQQPIVVDKDGVIIAGHTRLAAAKELGRKQVPVVVADLSPAKAKAYRLADNRVADETEWLSDLLAEEFASLDILKFDLSLTGFDAFELDEIMNSFSGDAGASGTKELDPDSYEMGHRCPRCGFEFNDAKHE